jgi:hypothetical protein
MGGCPDGVANVQPLRSSSAMQWDVRVTRRCATEQPSLTVAIFEDVSEIDVAMSTVELSAGRMRAAGRHVLSRDVDTVRRELSGAGADIVIWEVSPPTLSTSDGLLALLRQHAFGRCSLVVVTTDRIVLRALLGPVANDLVIVQQPCAAEALVVQLEYLAWTRLGLACGGYIDSHLRRSVHSVH